jgi:hypothetical protein
MFQIRDHAQAALGILGLKGGLPGTFKNEKPSPNTLATSSHGNLLEQFNTVEINVNHQAQID